MCTSPQWFVVGTVGHRDEATAAAEGNRKAGDDLLVLACRPWDALALFSKRAVTSNRIDRAPYPGVELLALMRGLIQRDYPFVDKEEAHRFFTQLTGLLKNLNYTAQRPGIRRSSRARPLEPSWTPPSQASRILPRAGRSRTKLR